MSAKIKIRWGKVLTVVIAVAWCAVALFIAIVTKPSIIVERAFLGTTPLPQSLPIMSNNTNASIFATIRFSAKSWQNRTIIIHGDDCFSSIEINAIKVQSDPCAMRTKNGYKKMTLPATYDDQDTVLTIVVKDTAGPPMGLNVVSAEEGIWPWLPRGMIMVLVLYCFIRLMRKKFKTDRILMMILFVGFVARILYGLSTPYGVRAYDADGHLEYVRYLSVHVNVPPAIGWEFHQPPLYYLLASTISRAGNQLGWPLTTSVPWIQLASIILSCGTLLAGAWIGSSLFRKDDKYSLRIFTMLLAGLPSLVMLSSRISNDVLVSFEIIIGAFLLLRWWREGRAIDWYLLWLLSAVAFLTKLNGLALPLGIIVLAIFQKKERRIPLRRWAAGIGLFLLLTAWLPVLRLQQNPKDIENFLMTGKSQIDSRLKIKRMPQDFITFNPIALVRNPFNMTRFDPRGSHSLEFLFRSAMFGEFNDFPVKWLAQSIIFLALLLLPWMAHGMANTKMEDRGEVFPVTILLLTTLILWLTYISIFQLTPEQDFRFSPFFAVAAAYFITRGLSVGPVRYRAFGLWCVFAFSALSILMLVA